MNIRNRVWKDNEIEMIVRDYLEMLNLELSGKEFNKADRNRELQRHLERTKGSIEYKHQNISAVMDRLGLPFIQGYKPAANYQTRLFEILENQLSDSRIWYQSTQPGNGVVYNDRIKFDDPPEIYKLPKRVGPKIQRVLRKFDPAARDARARELGEAGEKYFYNSERNRLSSVGRKDLAESVRWVSKEDGDGAGYDILSFTVTGEARWMEVKTTNGSKRTPFWITRNELEVSEENPDYFRLVRIFNFSRGPGAFKLKPPLKDHVNLQATQYHASF